MIDWGGHILYLLLMILAIIAKWKMARMASIISSI